MSRANLNGGKPLKGFPLEEEDGMLGYKIGYCSHCNEPWRVRTIDARDILTHFMIGEQECKNLLKKLKPKTTLKEYLIKWLGGLPNKTVDNL